MTVYSIIGGEQWDSFATTRGMGDFVRWAESLDPEKFPLLVHLADWGWVNEIDKLDDEIDLAMKATAPINSLLETLTHFRRLLERRPDGAESVMLTDGLTAGGDEDSDEWWVRGKPIEAREDEEPPVATEDQP